MPNSFLAQVFAFAIALSLELPPLALLVILHLCVTSPEEKTLYLN